MMFHEGSRQLQDRFDTRRTADRIEEVLVHDVITPHDAGFIRERDMFFIATADEDGRPNCSHRSYTRTRASCASSSASVALPVSPGIGPV